MAVEEKSRYVAERIARTEAARAWAEGFIERYADDKDVAAFKWHLSSRHPHYDICDLYAHADLWGLGPGIFPKDKTPMLPVHPHCLCWLSPVFKSEIEKSPRNMVQEGGQQYIDGLSETRKKQLLGVAGYTKYRQGKDWRMLARNYSPHVIKINRISVLNDISDEFLKNLSLNSREITYDNQYNKNSHKEETFIGKWLYETFGGTIHHIDETNVYGRKSADYLWNDELWDLKTISSEKAVDSALRHGIKQIKSNPGGIILWDIYDNLDTQEILQRAQYRLLRSARIDMKIILLHGKKRYKIYQYKVKKIAKSLNPHQ